MVSIMANVIKITALNWSRRSCATDAKMHTRYAYIQFFGMGLSTRAFFHDCLSTLLRIRSPVIRFVICLNPCQHFLRPRVGGYELRQSNSSRLAVEPKVRHADCLPWRLTSCRTFFGILEFCRSQLSGAFLRSKHSCPAAPTGWHVATTIEHGTTSTS